jgi:hypothetical protein
VFPLFYTGPVWFSDSKTLAGKKPYGASLGFLAFDYLSVFGRKTLEGKGKKQTDNERFFPLAGQRDG